MTYASWAPRYRVTTISPGKLDLFVVTFIDAKPATIDAIMDYESALTKAEAFHREHDRCQIKVLPMSGTEVFNLFGIKRPDRPEPMDAALHQQMVDTLMEIARTSSDTDARCDAFDLLQDMGVFPQ